MLLLINLFMALHMGESQIHYQSTCLNQNPLANSPGTSCKKPEGYDSVPTNPTTPPFPTSSATNMQLSSSSIGMRINVGASPAEIFIASYATNGVTQSSVASTLQPLDFRSLVPDIGTNPDIGNFW